MVQGLIGFKLIFRTGPETYPQIKCENEFTQENFWQLLEFMTAVFLVPFLVSKKKDFADLHTLQNWAFLPYFILVHYICGTVQKSWSKPEISQKVTFFTFPPN